MHLLKQSSQSIPRLVIVGQRDFRFQQIFDNIVELGLQNDVVVLESVDNNMLAHLYRAAKVFVYISMAEGFGLPPLEAMSCGCPVIVSNCTSLPEVVGDAGIQVAPESVEQVAYQLERVLGDTRLQAEMSVAGTKRAERFCWSNSARNMMTALQNLG